MARRGGLGKGLGALIPTGPGAEAAGGLREIDTASIRPNPYQPREHFDEEQLTELTESIREVGILQPVLVRPVGDEFELIAGERRWRAARRLGHRPHARARARRATTSPRSSRRWSRTSTARTSTRWRRPPPTSS